MKKYLKESWLVLLGYIAFAIGIFCQVHKFGTIFGDALIPLILIYSAYWLRQGKRNTASRLASENGVHKNILTKSYQIKRRLSNEK